MPPPSLIASNNIFWCAIDSLIVDRVLGAMVVDCVLGAMVKIF